MLKEILFLVIAICHLTYAVVHPPFVAGYKRTAKIYPHLPPVYDINLDLDYEDRWRELMTGKRDLVLRMYNLMTSQIDLPLEILHSVNYTVLEAHDVEYAKELLAISKLLSFSFEQTLLLSTFFDLVPRCTTFIIQDADNNVYQGRDADQFYADILEPMMYHARFFKNGKLLYQTVSKLAELGSLAGLRQNSYALNLNQYLVPFYYTGNKNGYEVIPEQIQRIYGEYLKSYADSLLPPQTNHLKKPPKMTRTGALMLARRVLENCETYDEAVEMIKKSPISSKAFYIVSGTESGQGAVIARSGDEVHHEAYLNPDEGIWYLVQDNYRRDISDPSHDNRRVAGEYELEKIGRDKITKDLVWTNLLEKYPLLSNVTLHSTITDPKTGEFKTIMWGWSKDEIKQWNSKKNVRLW